MLSDLSAELQHWLPGWRCPLRWRWLCWSRFQTWMPPRTHRPPRPRCPRLPPDVSCRPCRDGRSWRGNADCPPGWTLGRIYRTGKVSPLRERNRQRREVNHLKSRGRKAVSPFPPLLPSTIIIGFLPVWMIMCFDRSPTLTNALLHIWHLCGRTLSWCRMWLASWLDCTNLYRERHKIFAFKGWVDKNFKRNNKHIFSLFFFFKPAFSVLSSFISKSHRWRISGYIQEQVSLKNRTFVTAWTHLRTDLLPQRSHT